MQTKCNSDTKTLQSKLQTLGNVSLYCLTSLDSICGGGGLGGGGLDDGLGGGVVL